MKRANPQRGYSLIELMVALAVIAGVSLSLTEGLRFGGRTMTRAAALQQESADVLTTRRVLAEWFTNAQGHPLRRDQVITFQGDAQEVSFKTLAPAFPTARGFYDITLKIERARGGGSQLKLFRKADWLEEKAFETILIKSDAPMAFAYIGDGNWRNDWRNQKTPPLFVRLDAGLTRPLTFPIATKVAAACLASRNGRSVEIEASCK